LRGEKSIENPFREKEKKALLKYVERGRESIVKPFREKERRHR
jgi:hypothetical protein